MLCSRTRVRLYKVLLLLSFLLLLLLLVLLLLLLLLQRDVGQVEYFGIGMQISIMQARNWKHARPDARTHTRTSTHVRADTLNPLPTGLSARLRPATRSGPVRPVCVPPQPLVLSITAGAIRSLFHMLGHQLVVVPSKRTQAN